MLPDHRLTESYVQRLRLEFPRLRLREKRADLLSQAIAVALRILTANRSRSYLETVVTTIGSTIYLPLDWHARSDQERYIVLRHEAVHLRQFRRLGRVPMALLYLFPIAPLGLAYGRAKLEWEAYAETLRAIAELKGTAALADEALQQRVLQQFTGPNYGWMWPFPRHVRRWYAAVVAEIVDARPH